MVELDMYDRRGEYLRIIFIILDLTFQFTIVDLTTDFDFVFTKFGIGMLNSL